MDVSSGVDPDKIPRAAIAGIVVGALLVLVILLIVVIFLLSFRKWRRKQHDHSDNSEDSKLDSIFRSLDNKFGSKKTSKTSSQDKSVKYGNSNAMPEVRIEISEVSGGVKGTDKDTDISARNGVDNLGVDGPESPIRRSVNAYSEIDLGD